MSIEVTVPEVGESVSEVEILKWYKQEGDRVEEDEEIAQLETDKATVDLPAPGSGVIEELVHAEGDIVAVGEVIARLGEGDGEEPAKGKKKKRKAQKKKERKAREKEGAEKKGAAAKEEGQEQEQKEREAVSKRDGKKRKREANEEPARGEVFASPSARRALRKYGLEPHDLPVEGGRRVSRQDVEQYVAEHDLEPVETEKQAEAEAPEEAAQEKREKRRPKRPAALREPQNEEEVVPMSLIRRRIGERLVQAQQNSALLTTFNEIDMAEVIALRKRYRENFRETYETDLGFMPFFVKAAVDALKRYPAVNASIRGEEGKEVVYHHAYHIGIAIGSGKGLVVPVLRYAEQMSFAEIEEAIEDFAERAEANRLDPEDLQGGTFTISNGGIYGSLLSTPIVNPPQSGVLGMHLIEERPVAREGQVVIRPMMYVALTYDHRLIDGREAVSCLRRIKEAIEDPARMLLEV